MQIIVNNAVKNILIHATNEEFVKKIETETVRDFITNMKLDCFRYFEYQDIEVNYEANEVSEDIFILKIFDWTYIRE